MQGKEPAGTNRKALSHKSRADGARGSKGKTVGDVLEKTGGGARFLTEYAHKKPVSVILLCDSPAFGDKGLLDPARPHITLHLEDDLFQKIKDLQEENLRLQSLALVDSLTGLFNNRFFWMQLETEMERTNRTGLSCTLMMIDLDNFKLLNDAFGHLAGDRFLAEFGRIMGDNSRSTDLICRYGGDEFALIMPATSVDEALKTGERLMSIVAEMPQQSYPGISLSIGISEYVPYSTYGMNEFVRAADMAMYRAKKEGKDQICVDETRRRALPEGVEVSPAEKEALFPDRQ